MNSRLAVPLRLQFPKGITAIESTAVKNILAKHRYNRFYVRSIGTDSKEILPYSIVDLVSIRDKQSLTTQCLGTIEKRFTIEDLEMFTSHERSNVSLTVIERINISKGFICFIQTEDLKLFSQRFDAVCKYGNALENAEPHAPNKGELCIVQYPDPDGSLYWYRSEFQTVLSDSRAQENDDMPIDISHEILDDTIEDICVEKLASKKERKKHNWTVEASYEDLEEAVDYVTSEGFALHKNHDLKIGQKFHFRCKNVPSDCRPWCDRQYVIFLPSDRLECIVQHNNAQHNCHQLMKGKKKRMSEKLKNFIFGIFEKGTHSISSVLAHISEAMNKNDKFPADNMPNKRQIEYLLGKYRNSEVKPLFEVGDLMNWCEAHSIFPENDDEVFVISHECSSLSEAMNFRFVLSTPEMLMKAKKFEIVCIDATYKLNWHGFPLIVLGTVDRLKRFHPAAYACCTNETTADYEFVFEAVRDAIESCYEEIFEPKILIADGADAIRNSFYNTFPSAEIDIMCFAHVIRNVRKRAFNTKTNKQLVLDDIRKIQLAANKNTFLMMTNLMCEKWLLIEPDFVEYFKKEWLGGHCNWFEGAAIYTPSTNNALESHNAVIKRSITMRKRLPLNQFSTCISKLMSEISKQFMSGEREIVSKPAVHKNLMREAALLQQANFKAFKAKSQVPTYIVPSSNCPAKFANISYYTTLVAKRWNSFDEFINHGYQLFWIVILSSNAWDAESNCTCPAFFKNNICKHITALAMRENLLKYTDNMNPTVITAVRKRPGRPKNASNALSRI